VRALEDKVVYLSKIISSESDILRKFLYILNRFQNSIILKLVLEKAVKPPLNQPTFSIKFKAA
jgi:hypothetical protein